MLKQMYHRVAALAVAIFLALWGVSAQGQEQIFPPWSHGKNAPAIDKGLEFTVPEVDNLPDFHGSIDTPNSLSLWAVITTSSWPRWWRPLRRSTRISRAGSTTKPCRQAS
jgi:hypothetical protein